jgi:hypothetical protein
MTAMRGHVVERVLIASLLMITLYSPVALGSSATTKREIDGVERQRTAALRAGDGDASWFAADAIEVGGGSDPVAMGVV